MRRANGSSPLRTLSFNTSEVAPHERLAFWRDAVCATMADVDMTRSGDAPFHGGISWREFAMEAGDRVALLHIDSVAQAARRTRRHVAGENENWFTLCLQTKGAARIDENGRDNPMGHGDLWLKDSTVTGSIEFDSAFEQLVLPVPYARLAPRLPANLAGSGSNVSGASPLGAVLGAHLTAVSRSIDRLDAPEREALLDATIDLVALTFSAERRKFCGTSTTVRRALVMRARRFVEARLADPRLSAGMVARTLGVSIGYLQHAFQAAGTTLGAHIRRRRLERCRDDLADPQRAGEKVSEIAMRWGFNDMPHFSRAFRTMVGLSPREYRAAAVALRARGR